MPVYQRLVNFDQLFHQLREPPIIVNDLANDTEEERESIRNIITTRFTSDLLSILPSCQCGKTKGEFAIGDVCHYCNTEVVSQVEESIEPIVWFRRPQGVERLINPHIYGMLAARFKKSGFDVLGWLLDTSNNQTDKKQPPILNDIMAAGIQRGYNNFARNFDQYINILFSLKDYQIKKPKKGQPYKADYLLELIQRERHSIFSDHIPFLNKSLLILEKTNVGRYINPLILHAIDTIEMVVSIDRKFADHPNPLTGQIEQKLVEHNLRIRENRTAKMLSKLSNFYIDFISQNVSPKPGLFRKHFFSTRTYFSFRAVISSITKPHNYDEVEVPWGVGVTVFHEHLLSKLLRRGMALNEAIGFLRRHVQRYNPMIDELFHELIDESPEKGLVCIVQRNPSLLQGSAQRFRITKIKTDIVDTTLGLSILCVKAPNADFDGDELNVMLAIDNHMAELWKPLAPHHNIFVADSPREMSGYNALPKPITSTISAWLEDV